MLVRCMHRRVSRPLAVWWVDARCYSAATISQTDHHSVARTRNIGIVAHIDAGKTTTTERMLFYSGFTRRLGDVDQGSTVTDFLPAERERGITIQAAAVTFHWPPTTIQGTEQPNISGQLRASQPHSINLIDTPGHADFTFEVLRSLRVLDGVVCVLDGVAGVEAQTEKVWAQATHYKIPGVFFVNKLDREGASFARTVREIATRLNVWPAVCQIPWWSKNGTRLLGLGDVINLKARSYDSGSDGTAYQTIHLPDLEREHHAFAQELKRARHALVELLSSHDDTLIETFFHHNEDHLAIPPERLIDSLRLVTLTSPQQVAAVLAGSSLKNVGVQALLDAVVNLLPSPNERPDTEVTINQDSVSLRTLLSNKVPLVSSTKHITKTSRPQKALVDLKSLAACALAFKVVSDPRRGVLVYVRVYSGSITRSSQLYNTNLGITEKASRLLRMYANDAVDIEQIPAGHIGVIPGLRHARTGDTLIVYTGTNPKVGPPAPLDSLQLRPINVPPPVFFASVEPNSLGEQKHVQDALQLLLREDPSLHVQQDVETGQTHLAGMGELHLEIAGDRLINDLRAKARLGNIQVGYRETITMPTVPKHFLLDRDVAGKSAKAGCTSSISFVDDTNNDPRLVKLTDGNTYTLTLVSSLETEQTEEKVHLPVDLPLQSVQQAVRNGISAALSHGPTHGFQMHSVHVAVSLDTAQDLYPSTTPAALAAAVRLSVRLNLRSSSDQSQGTMLMEPIMNITLSVDEASLGDVAGDISSARDGQIISLDSDADGHQKSRDAIQAANVYVPPDPFEQQHTGLEASLPSHQHRQIKARVPLRKMIGYLKHLRSLTAGRGTFVMSVDTFEKMGSHRMKAALASIYGDPS